MAFNNTGDDILSRKVLDDLVQLLWGSNINDDIFQRWNQGFTFGEDEPTALLQYDGGPCAVIVPVQAFLLRNLFFSLPTIPDSWRQTNGTRRNNLLCSALADILCQATASQLCSSVVLCHIADDSVTTLASTANTSSSSASSSPPPSTDTPPPVTEHPASPPDEEMVAGPEVAAKRQRLGHEQFHSRLRTARCSSRQDMLNLLEQHLIVLSSQHGVLLFLYSLLITKGLDRIQTEIGDAEEPLIDPIHGHGSQSLINLLLTGQAVPHVWDNEKNVSGLRLQGISSRSEIGFLTLLEHLRYCEVGWYLKNPKCPIWVLGSETHLTVLFSQDRSLVGDEGQESVVRQMFSRFDEDGRGFINAESLSELLKLLDLVSIPDYVKIITEKLDPEQLGVITFDTFVNEFYPGVFNTSNESDARPFVVYHYNGLQRTTAVKVTYAKGTCTVPDMPELQMISDFSPIKTCLLTKWPTIELKWNNGTIPSLN